MANGGMLRRVSTGWDQVWFPTANPLRATRRASAGSVRTCEPIMKKVAGTCRAVRIRTRRAVAFGEGPSSNVRATSPAEHGRGAARPGRRGRFGPGCRPGPGAGSTPAPWRTPPGVPSPGPSRGDPDTSASVCRRYRRASLGLVARKAPVRPPVSTSDEVGRRTGRCAIRWRSALRRPNALSRRVLRSGRSHQQRHPLSGSRRHPRGPLPTQAPGEGLELSACITSAGARACAGRPDPRRGPVGELFHDPQEGRDPLRWPTAIRVSTARRPTGSTYDERWSGTSPSAAGRTSASAATSPGCRPASPIEELFAAHPHITVDRASGQRHESAFVRGWVSLPAHGLPERDFFFRFRKAVIASRASSEPKSRALSAAISSAWASMRATRSRASRALVSRSPWGCAFFSSCRPRSPRRRARRPGPSG